MTKYEFKKFPILATVVTIVGLLAAIFSISISLMTSSYDGFAALALLEIVATVLVLAGLTTGKVTLLKVISIIMTISVLLASFSLAIAKYSVHDGILFTVSLVMLVCSVLSLVYFLTIKNQRIEKLYFIASIIMLVLVAIYTLSPISMVPISTIVLIIIRFLTTGVVILQKLLISVSLSLHQ